MGRSTNDVSPASSGMQSTVNTETPRLGTSMPLGLIFPVAVFLVTFLLVLGVGTSFYTESQRFVLAQEIADLSDESELLTLLFEQIYRESANDVAFLSGTPPIQHIIAAKKQGDNESHRIWRQRLEQIFYEMLRTKPNYSQLHYVGIDNNGKDLVDVARTQNTITIEAPEEMHQNGDFDYFNAALSLGEGKVYFSPITVDHENKNSVLSQKPVMKVAIPINDQQDGTPFGIVVISVEMEFIFARVEKIDLHELVFYLANEDGDFFYHPSSEMRFGFERGSRQRIQHAFPELASAIRSHQVSTGFTALEDDSGKASASFYRQITLDQYGVQVSYICYCAIKVIWQVQA